MTGEGHLAVAFAFCRTQGGNTVLQKAKRHQQGSLLQ
jgi:hypothetical protein